MNTNSLFIAKKNATAWYSEAKKLEQKGHLISAILRTIAAKKVLRPVPFIIYEEESDILEFSKKVTNKFTSKYSLPITVDIESKPQIYGIYALYPENKLVPLFVYVTKINIFDKKKIKEEANKIALQLKRIMPGLKSDHEYIVFRAFSELPTDSKIEYKYMGTVIRTNDI